MNVIIEITPYLKRLNGTSDAITIVVISFTNGLILENIPMMASVDIPNSLAYIGNITNKFDAIANKLVATVASTIPITAPFLVRCFI